MALQYSTTHRNNAMADLTTQIGTTGFLLIYSGTVPASAATAATGTLLASLPCSNPFAPAPSGGVLTASAITSATAAATGTAGYFRICTSSAGTTCVLQGTVGTSGADLNLNSTSISSGQTVSVTSFAITAFGA
jgi:hypothetical protein